jgi:hypothetical protein
MRKQDHKSILLNLPIELLDRIDAAAGDVYLSRTAWVRQACAYFLAHVPTPVDSEPPAE